ncbi:hypothetical protein GA0115249_106334 [Streptomyces sp. PpalLS-921]|nr:hypothetical protein GA0115249_106334 [Streptomyces sp. PpalLS-921]
MALQPISIDELRRRNEQSQAARDAEKAAKNTTGKG